MPELPEVQTVLDGVVKELRGRQIHDIQCFLPGTVIRDPEIVQEPFPAKLTGHERRGKYMILHLERGNSLIIHLRMTGKLVSDAAMQSQSKHERACILLSGGRKMHFVDIRTFGKIILCRTSNIPRFMAPLGLEPLSDEFNAEYLKEFLAGRKTPIKSLLMDQSKVAGLGNIYACEILYRSRIHPETPANKLSLPRLKKMVVQTKQVLKEAISKNGTSISDFRRVDEKTGEFQNFLQVYQQEKCPRGHDVKKIRQSGRGTYFCPICQKK